MNYKERLWAVRETALPETAVPGAAVPGAAVSAWLQGGRSINGNTTGYRPTVFASSNGKAQHRVCAKICRRFIRVVRAR